MSPGSPAPSGAVSDDGDAELPLGGTSAAASLRMREIVEVRNKVKETRAALRRGDWNGCWRQSMVKAAELGQQTLKSMEAALATQAMQLRKAHETGAIEGKATVASIVKSTQEQRRSIELEFERVRDAKVGLCRSRNAAFKEAIENIDVQARRAEAELHPLITSLAREAEMVLELGHAHKRGEERLPAGVIAGAWRRSLAALFPLLLHLWEGAAVSEAQKQAVTRKIFAMLTRADAGRQALERVEQEKASVFSNVYP